MQQDRSRYRGHFARHNPAFDASDLFLAIPDWHASASRPAANIARPFTILSFHDFMTWPGFVRVGWPLLVGSLFLAIPSAIVTYSDHAPACQSSS